MDFFRFCLCASLAISCLVQMAASVPLVVDVDFDFDTDSSLKNIEDMGTLEPKDIKDVYDLALLPNRARRNIAQLITGAIQYNPSATNRFRQSLRLIPKQNVPPAVTE
ncbi:unnamed protein product [Candidula unifasciata]|uniref:Uncharacterized protein n=1 Tax=Candidula unifasciata TaxID=100452 RepID=A0A8S3ZXB5_9EUPU|nr:unnamed protein product [Candidula unifasciata]